MDGQIELTHRSGAVTAEIHPRGAGLRSLVVDGTQYIQQFAGDAPPFYAGLTLAPWPNRVRGGKWALAGEGGQLDQNEVARPNAIHGLVHSARFDVQPLREDSVRLTTTVRPARGWQFEIALTVDYTLSATGIRVDYRAHNTGTRSAPFAIGAHPFFTVGSTPVAELWLTAPARRVLLNDAQGIPAADVSVDDHPELDLRTRRSLIDLRMAQCYTDFVAEDGVVGCTLTDASGAGLRVWADPVFRYWQFFTTDSFPTLDGVVAAVALEPMTAPGDALNSGSGIRWIPAGGEWAASWGCNQVVP